MTIYNVNMYVKTMYFNVYNLFNNFNINRLKNTFYIVFKNMVYFFKNLEFIFLCLVINTFVLHISCVYNFVDSYIYTTPPDIVYYILSVFSSYGYGTWLFVKLKKLFV